MLQSYFTYWDVTPHVFAEPDVNENYQFHSRTIFHRNHIRYGCVANWFFAAKWIYENTDTPYILAMEDDIEWTGDAAKFLRTFMLYGKILDRDLADVGFVSPYCSLRNTFSLRRNEWHAARNQKNWCGALALLLPRESLHVLMSNAPMFMVHAMTNVASPIHLDHALGMLLKDRGLYTHTPTLIYHQGSISTMKENNTLHAQNHISRSPAL